MAAQRSAPFSTHSRGVPLFNRNRLLDFPRHVAALLLDLRDISSSAFWFLTCQTFLTFWTALTTLCSVTFFTYFGQQYSLAANLDWTLTCFVVILPIVGFTWIAYGRRERALDELSKAKVLMMSLYTAHRDWAPPEDKHSPEHMLAVRSAIGALLETMHEYFLASRFYARFYPYFGFRGAMVQIALDRARHVRRVGAAVQQLTAAATALGAAGLSAALEAQLHERVFQLQLSLDRLANGVRSMARFYVCLYIPIFFGPYWAWLSSALGFGFAFFYSILLSIAIVGVLNLAVSLEDPFDNSGMDGVFIDEALYEVEQLIVGPAMFPAGFDVPAAGTIGGDRAGGGADLRSSAPAVLAQQQQAAPQQGQQQQQGGEQPAGQRVVVTSRTVTLPPETV
ncbi:hypothetical protein N2152v2_008736 [Parachlorella kessleri]